MHSTDPERTYFDFGECDQFTLIFDKNGERQFEDYDCTYNMEKRRQALMSNGTRVLVRNNWYNTYDDGEVVWKL